MPPTHPRITITLDNNTNMLLKDLARQKNKSVSHLAKELILEALDLYEDKVLSAIAESRDTKDAKKISPIKGGKIPNCL